MRANKVASSAVQTPTHYNMKQSLSIYISIPTSGEVRVEEKELTVIRNMHSSHSGIRNIDSRHKLTLATFGNPNIPGNPACPSAGPSADAFLVPMSKMLVPTAHMDEAIGTIHPNSSRQQSGCNTNKFGTLPSLVQFGSAHSLCSAQLCWRRLSISKRLRGNTQCFFGWGRQGHRET